ncbi:MAG: hypothetical protein R2736_02640 [Solirubrobacterales bacterium]
MRLPDGRPPRMDWYGHNPFSTRFPRLAAQPYAKGVRDLSDIDTLHRELAAAYGSRRTPKLWLSEFTVSSDHPNRAFNFAVSRRQQAKWVTAAFRLVNSVDYVAGLGWFDLLRRVAGHGQWADERPHDVLFGPAQAGVRRLPERAP